MIEETMQNLNLAELLKLLRRGETKVLYTYRLGRYVRLSPATMNMVIKMKDYYSIIEFKKEVEKFLNKHKIHGIERDDKSYIKLILDDLKQLKEGLSLRSPEIWVDYILFLSRHLQNMDAKTWERKMFCCIAASILSHLLPPEISVNVLLDFPPPHSFLEEQYHYYSGIAREYYFNLTEAYLSHGENELAFQSFNRLEPLWWDSFGFLILKGRIEILKCNMRNPSKFKDLMNIFKRALNISKGGEKIVALFYIGLANYQRGDFREAQNAWKQCLKLEHTLERKIILYHNLAEVYRLSGNFENAKKLYEKSIGLAEALEEKEEFRFESLIGLSTVLIDLCLWEEAEEKLREAIPDCTEKGFFLLSSLAKANLGFLMGKKGEYEEALEYYVMALDLVDKKYNSRWYSTITANFGNTLQQLRRTDEALIALEEALESARNESLVLIQSIEIKLADLFIDIGNFNESWELAQTVLGDSWLDNHRSEAEAWRIQGKILLHEGKFQDAKNSLEESERIFRKLNLKYELLEVLELLEMCYKNLKD